MISFNDWFKANFRIPEKNVSLYMRRLLKAAFKAGQISNQEQLRKAYRTGYDKGYRVRRRIR